MITPYDVRVAVEARWAAVVKPAIQALYAAAGGALDAEPNRRPGLLWYDKAYEFSCPPYGVFAVSQDGETERVAYSPAYAVRFKASFGVYADQNLPPALNAAVLAAADMAVWTPAALALRNGTVLYVGFGEAAESFEPQLRNGNDVALTAWALTLLCEGSTAAA